MNMKLKEVLKQMFEYMMGRGANRVFNISLKFGGVQRDFLASLPASFFV